MSARDVIASLLEDEFGRHADEQADAIIAGLEASDFSIVHKDEIHAPSVERAALIADKRARMAKVASHEAAIALLVALPAALRELMKEVG